MSSPECQRLNVTEVGATSQREWLSNLMGIYGQEILSFVRFYTKTTLEAEDLTQEVFLRAYRSYHEFRGDSHVKTWLLRIAINVCKDYYRSRKRRPLWYVDDIPDTASSVGGMRQNNVSPSAEEEVIETLVHTDIVESVLHLPPGYKEVILLHYFEHQSIAEVAETLGVSQSTIKTRLFRARKMLRSEEGEPT